ncbi:MAG TPA: hypothetical protein VN673_18845 [Clostridia bacterium]|nr:hypothetical protein [Clostridia bacterium]
MQRRVPRSLTIAILLIVAAALAGYAYFGDTSMKQARRMKLGREYLPGITSVVDSYPEFRDVRVGVGTAKSGCFLAVGIVDTPEQLSKLQAIIAATKPPLEVVYSVKVLQDNSEQPRAEPGGPANRDQPVVH